MSLKQATLSAGRWTATSAFFRTSLLVLQTMVLARLLLPAHFGLMAVVGALLAVVWMFSDFGLSRALIHFEHIPADSLSSLYWLNIVMALLLMLLLGLAAPVIGMLYQEPQLMPLVWATSVMFPLSALGQQYRVLAEKELRFAALARNEIASSVIGFLIAVTAAWLGAGVYAIVFGMLVNTACSSLLAWWLLSHGGRPAMRLRVAETKPYLKFGSYLVGDNFASTLNRQADIFIGGLLFGPAAIGVYSVPRDLSLRVSTMINPIVTRVGFPVMARVQNDPVALKSIYLQTLRMTASVNFPLYIALAVFADDAVALLYGPKWHDAAAYLQILALWGLIRSVGNPVGSLLYAVGRARLAMSWNVGQLLFLIPIYWVAGTWGGLQGLAYGVVALQILMFLPVWWLLVYPLCGASLGEYLRQIVPPLLLSLAAAAIAHAVAGLVDHRLLRVAMAGTAGGLTYLGLSMVFNRPWAEAMLELLRPGVDKRVT